MSDWQSALRRVTERLKPDFSLPIVIPKEIDWARVVVIDFETYYDADYTLSKLSTSEYIRDPRFKAQMMYLKIGDKAAEVLPTSKIKARLAKINWATHSLLCHNTQFDGLILSHHYKVVPSYYLDTLSMARGLHSNEIGAGLEEVSIYYGGTGKLKDILEQTKGVRDWSPALFETVTPYCLNDGDETLRIFKEMVRQMPAEEMDLIDLVTRMFCDPILRVDMPRVEAELKRELDRREKLMMSVIDVRAYESEIKDILKTKAERALPEPERTLLTVKRVIGSNERFANLLRQEGLEPPTKISPAWMKKPSSERSDEDEDKYTYAFAKDDPAFINLPQAVEDLFSVRSRSSQSGLKKLIAKQERVQLLIDTRLAVKSTTNVTRAQRFLNAGANGWQLPVGYAYYRAHTGRLGGNNKMNMQNLTRGGELRKSILAQPGHMLLVGDSGQIEARVNAWLWGQTDLIDAFRAADAGTGRDAYCLFADSIYHRTITKEHDETERFVGKVCVLGLGYSMGAEKLQLTLAKGALGGPPVFFTLQQCQDIISTYRRKNHWIMRGWRICDRIISDMARGERGTHGPIRWTKETIFLPNGMCLKYPDLREEIDPVGYTRWTYQSGVTRKSIYGGLLCENIVQALARIIVMTQMLELAKSGRVVMTTHDEITQHIPKRSIALAAKRMHKVMTTPLKWCLDLPLASEIKYDVNYPK